MSRVFIFDVDGTLTPARRQMEGVFRVFFEKWLEKNKFYLVTGSNIEKLQEQMSYLDINAEAIFACSGNEMWIPDPHITNISAYQEYENKFEPPKELIEYLNKQLAESLYKIKAGTHIEDRKTMVNFSIVGRDCTMEQRNEYFMWDTITKERQRIASEINLLWPELSAAIGGQISIDIYPKGQDKSQVLEHIEKRENADEYIFFGDRTMEGGNDYPLAYLMGGRKDCKVHQVDSWEETKTLLENYSETDISENE